MLFNAIRRSKDGGDRVRFEVIFLTSPRRRVTATFKAVCGPGDDGQSVITILIPNED